MTIAIIELVDMDYIVVAEGSAALASAAIQAENAADRAEAAADTAVIAAAAVGAYPTVLDGENATDPGQSFFVYSGGAVTLYVNNAGVGEPVAPLATASDIAARPTFTELASTDPGEGAKLVGFQQNWAGSQPRSVLEKLQDTSSVLDAMNVFERQDVLSNTGSIDVTAAVQTAEDAAGTVLFPAGRYKIASTVTRKQNSVWIGDGPEATIVEFSGTGDNLMELGTSDYVRTEGIQFLSLAGKASITDEVAVRLGPDGGAVFSKFINCIFDGWSVAGIYQTRGWNNLVENCYFIRCGNRGISGDYTGGIVYDPTGSGTAGWSGSGTRAVGCTFISCEYGIYNDSMWNAVCDNCVFEDIGCAFYKSPQGAMMVFNECWFEDADNQPRIEGAVQIVGGRSPTNGGQNPSSGVKFDGISGTFGRVMYHDADVIEHYSDNTGVPIASIDFANKTVYADTVQSRTSGVALQSSTGEKVILDNSNGDFRPDGTNALQDLGGPSNRWRNSYSEKYYVGAGTRFISAGSGTPEGNVTAPVGSIWMRTEGGAGTSMYVKESGTGNTGWVAK